MGNNIIQTTTGNVCIGGTIAASQKLEVIGNIALGDSTTGDYDAWLYFKDDGNNTAHKFGWDDGLGALASDDPLVLFSTQTVELRNDGADPEVTYIVLYNKDGEKCYIYPNTTQDGIVVSATKP